MHGRVKVRTTAEQEAIKKVERAKKVAQYKAAIDLVINKRKEKVYDDELLLVTEKMVLQNPDINSVWNIRREAFQYREWSHEEYLDRLRKELTLTESCLRGNPKSYSVWHQRCWIIDHLPEPDWQTELSLCAKCLNLDERNFHCWDYRQHLVKKAGISDAEEFEFSTTKIYNNFSNYSSWHYRSKILSKMFPDESGELPIVADKHKEELDLVMNATFTDPNDSSAWFYQRWLLDYSNPQPNALWRVKITPNRATIIFHGETSLESSNLSLTTDNGQVNGTWSSYNDEKFSKIWTATFSELLDSSCSKIFIKYENENYNLFKSDNAWFYKSSHSPIDKHNKAQLKEQMENYKQLKEMEPNNKWAILTGIFLMKSYDLVEYHEKILEDLSALIKIDHLRANYYTDMRSKCIMDYELHNLWKNENDTEINSTVDLSNRNLTIFYNEQYFGLFEEVNLGTNRLGNSLHRLAVLQECKKLSLSSNSLKNLKGFPTLQNLEILSLRDNQLTCLEEVLDLIKRHKFVKLDLRGNPLCEQSDIIDKLSKDNPDIEFTTD
ncbi:geranylgeranyl transferase type-2 subunit alpha [Fopius arisanus]|uniref:Geranylgeranyl transferase type-2 subunit alpha n=1 Tax=Fopius arisanus TaxID=64838 RepID=A0A9R1SYS7_9HYME|nr:PREDICTED: geranylgeranyl transferase type-2 subunit alpha [Fopius arisanus]